MYAMDNVGRDTIAMVLAGGKGERLKSLTKDTPKPMLRVGDRPLLERIICQLQRNGIRCINISTHYQEEKISSHFKDGKEFGLDIQYINEDFPRGTAGAISMLDDTDQPLLVINGDILTDVDFSAMLEFHRENHAELTVGVRQYDIQVPYGVVECEGVRITRIREKPLYTFFVNAGIYLLEPNIRALIPRDEKYDMTDLIEMLMKKGRAIVSFPIIEYRLDIGNPEDYAQAQEDVKNGRIKH